MPVARCSAGKLGTRASTCSSEVVSIWRVILIMDATLNTSAKIRSLPAFSPASQFAGGRRSTSSRRSSIFPMDTRRPGKNDVDVRIDEAANRESDLLAFQLAIEQGQPGAVMCAYNSVNGVHACRSNDLLNRTLKGDWGYRGWVMSDWGAVDGVDAAINGLDQESGEQWDGLVFFGESLQRAVQAGQVPESRLSDMVRRILRSMFAVAYSIIRQYVGGLSVMTRMLS